MTARVEGVVARLQGLHPKLIDLSLDRLRALLAKLGSPEQRLPPVIHVAGTNGKGSTCAFLRAIAEAAGLRAHVYTSPHLVRFNERIRIAGALVSDETLSGAIEEIESVNAGAPITVFEVITATALLLFARVPADLCILEVGLGGRGDATNVVARPATCAITSISLDHRDFLGDTLAAIAREKAGIMKTGVPVCIGEQPPEVQDILLAEADRLGAPVLMRGRDWRLEEGTAGCFRFVQGAAALDLPAPALSGLHQRDNASIAIAAMRASGLPIPQAAMRAGMENVRWPGRLQRLPGGLGARLPAGWELWLDGGHNPGGAAALARHFESWRDRPLHLIVGMKQTKDVSEFLRPLAPLADTIWAVAEPGQELALDVAAIIDASGGIARAGPTVAGALARLPLDGGAARVLICGSLYLAGEVLKADGAAADAIGSE